MYRRAACIEYLHPFAVGIGTGDVVHNLRYHDLRRHGARQNDCRYNSYKNKKPPRPPLLPAEPSEGFQEILRRFVQSEPYLHECHYRPKMRGEAYGAVAGVDLVYAAPLAECAPRSPGGEEESPGKRSVWRQAVRAVYLRENVLARRGREVRQ